MMRECYSCRREFDDKDLCEQEMRDNRKVEMCRWCMRTNKKWKKKREEVLI